MRPQGPTKALKLGGLICLAFVLAMFSFRLFFGLVNVPTESMEPSIDAKSKVWVNRLAYGQGVAWGDSQVVSWATPTPGDIVVFKTNWIKSLPVSATYLVKRVVAVAGQQVFIQGNKLTINGKPVYATKGFQIFETLNEATYQVLTGQSLATFGPVDVPVGFVFVMGDNRVNSFDSRNFGLVPENKIEGKVWQ